MDVLAFITLFITGFTSCAEFGSYAFVHPVIRRLPQQHHVEVEKGLLKTFGRVMPVLMTLCVFLSISYAIKMNNFEGSAQIFRWASAGSFIAALVSTIMFNVPINLATGKWSAENPPDNWKEKRNRWEFFQALRSWLLLIGFVLLCVAITQQS
jgi:predicted membrane protein